MEAQWKESPGPAGRAGPAGDGDRAGCSARSRTTWTGWRRGACGPCCSPSPGTGRCACPKSGGRPWPPSSRYDQAQRDIGGSDGRIGVLLREKDGLRIDRIRRDALLEEKGELLKALGGETGARLARLDQQLDELEHQRREVGEAISAGRTAESALSAVLNSLDSAEDWGTWDMLGGGLLTTMAKHGHLDDAQAGIGWAQQCLSRFRTELADVRDMELPQVQVGEFATFADYFFDGIFVDWYIQSRINDAQRGVEAVDSRVCEVLNRLQWMDQELAEEQDGLKREREGLLLRSSGSD